MRPGPGLFGSLVLVLASLGTETARADPAPGLADAGSDAGDAALPPLPLSTWSEPEPAPASIPAAPPTVVVTEPTDAGAGGQGSAPNRANWESQYEAARQRLSNGDFAGAGTMFARLVDTAPAKADRDRAREQENLANEWLRRGIVLAPREKRRSPGKRDLDELAMLYTSAALYGIGSAGWAIALTQPTTAEAAVLPLLGFTGASLGTVAVLDATGALHYGTAQAIVSGLYLGLENGIVWTEWNQEKVGDHWQSGTIASVVWGFSTTGAIAGGVVAAKVPTTPGRASWVGSTGLWAGTVSALASGALNPDDSTRKNSAWLAGGIGLNAGIVAGLVTAGAVAPSIARARFIDLGAFCGAVALGGGYLALSSGDFSGRTLSGALALGVTGGLVGAWFATSRMPHERVQHEKEDSRDKTALVRSVDPAILPAPGGAMIGVRGVLF